MPKYRAIKDAILKEVAENDVKVNGEATEEVTGFLEVEVDGKLIHSKKNGDGYVNTADKMKKIIDAVKKAIESKKTPQTPQTPPK